MTEFTGVGLHCSAKGCNQQDFLPFTCDCCNGECVTFSIVYSCSFSRAPLSLSRAHTPLLYDQQQQQRQREDSDGVGRLVRFLSKTKPREENREQYLCEEHSYTPYFLIADVLAVKLVRGTIQHFYPVHVI